MLEDFTEKLSEIAANPWAVVFGIIGAAIGYYGAKGMVSKTIIGTITLVLTAVACGAVCAYIGYWKSNS